MSIQIGFRAAPLAALLVLLVVCGSAASAQDVLTDEPVCEPPISVCKPRLASDSLFSSISPDRERCPSGFECVCVPSCPECDDCAAEVCVPGPQCETACDCPAGLGCFDGECIAGFAPIYCCDSDRCPPGQMCQDRDGAFGACFDPKCEERVRKVNHVIAKWVERASACEESSECVQIDTGTECRGTCGAFVNKRFARVLGRRIDWLDKRICGTYQEDGCPFATPSCQAQRPACVERQCTGVPILPGPPHPRPIDKVDVVRPGVIQELEQGR